MKATGERWPGEHGSAPVPLAESVRRWSMGNAGVVIAADAPTYCFVREAEADDGGLVLSCSSRALDGGLPLLDVVAGWEALAPRIRGCTRDLDEWGAGLYQAHLLYLCREGWARVDLRQQDPETLARVVLRDVAAALGDRPRLSSLQIEVHKLSPEYDCYLVSRLQRQQIAGAA